MSNYKFLAYKETDLAAQINTSDALSANQITIIVTLITALAAILSPLITAIITSHRDIKLAKINQILPTYVSSVKNFSHAYHKCQYGLEKTGYIATFTESGHNLLTLCQKHSTRKQLFRLINEVNRTGVTETTDMLFNRCLKHLAEEL